MSTLRELAASVRDRRVGAAELAERSLKRIEERDGDLNAVVALRAEDALAEARALDDALARGEPAGPLAGLPTLVKDITDVAGMVTTWGSLTHASAAAATTDALVVARLRAAAAIVVGKTNVPEFAIEGFSSNRLFGTTRNPWHRERTTGGSSGGSAAALASGMTAIATATDGGGSIRIPSAYCGLVGLKPTNGVIARDPQPGRMDYTTDWIDYSTDGPMSWHVDDLRLLLEVMRGPGPGDPSALPPWVGTPPPWPGPGRVVALDRWSAFGPLPAEVAAPFERALTRFAEVFAVDIERMAPEAVLTGSIDDEWFTVCAAEQAHQLGRTWIEEHRDDLHHSSRDFLTFGLTVAIDAYVAARKRRFDHARALSDLLGSDGLVLSPVMAVDACPAEGIDGATGADWYCTQAQNVTGHPALSLPAGTHASGVPFGLQVTGPRFREDILLDVATSWEEAEPWPLTAPGYDLFG